MTEIYGNSLTEVYNREKKIAVVAVEISLRKFKTSTAMLLKMTQRERRKHVFFFAKSHHSVDTESFCNYMLSTLQKYCLNFAENLSGKPGHVPVL